MNATCIIIIPCIDLNDYVVESIRGCLALDYGSYRVVVLPDVPISPPADLVDHPRIRIVVTGDLTIAAKRNLAIRRYRDADYYALIDSDAYPDAKWLANGISFLEKKRDIWALGGPNITPPGEPFLQRIVGNARRSFLVSGPLHFARNRSSSRDCTNLHSCNLILPRIVFETVGGFDESLYSGEDRDLCHRILAAGKRIYFNQDVVVYHHNRRFGKPFNNQCLAYGHGSISINRKTRNRSNYMLYVPVIWGGICLTAILAAISGTGSALLPILFISAGLGAAVVESVRCSDTWQEVPYTLGAILSCYTSTTAGQLLALMGSELDLKRIYTNYPDVGKSVKQKSSPSMNWKMIRIIDRWAGIPLLHLMRLLPRKHSRNQDLAAMAPRQVLFIKFWGIGNIFMILPAIQAVRMRWPHIEVDFLTLESNREALEATGAVRDVAMISTRDVRRFIATWRAAVATLRKRRYDVIIDCEQFSRYSAIMTMQVGAPVSIGFDTRGQYRHSLYSRPVAYDNTIHITQSFHSLVRAAGIELAEPPRLQLTTLSALRKQGRQLLARLDQDTCRPVVLMHIGTSANFQERRWLPDRYAALADRLVERWNATIIFTGLPDECRLIAETVSHLSRTEHTINLGGQLAFIDYFGLIAASHLVISADTAAVHLASAVNTPVVGLYGPNTPRLYGPWGDRGLALYEPPPCSPCITNFNAKLHTCRHTDGRGACMAAIRTDAVLDELQYKFPDLAVAACHGEKEVLRS
ncbi:MAG: glycosyltransferase family 9 protein [Nitrospirota bacterium]